MSINEYQIYIEADEIGTDHTCGYCSDADASLNNIIEINRQCNFSIDVPNKNFVKKYVDSNGEINLTELYDYNQKHKIYETKKRLCSGFGSGYCGCSVSTILKSARLVEKKENIKQIFLNNVSTDEDNDKDSDNDLNNYLKNDVSTNNQLLKLSTYKHACLHSKAKPKFYSSSYKIRCSKIPCKFHPNCKFRFSIDRPCLFKH